MWLLTSRAMVMLSTPMVLIGTLALGRAFTSTRPLSGFRCFLWDLAGLQGSPLVGTTRSLIGFGTPLCFALVVEVGVERGLLILTPVVAAAKVPALQSCILHRHCRRVRP